MNKGYKGLLLVFGAAMALSLLACGRSEGGGDWVVLGGTNVGNMEEYVTPLLARRGLTWRQGYSSLGGVDMLVARAERDQIRALIQEDMVAKGYIFRFYGP